MYLRHVVQLVRKSAVLATGVLALTEPFSTHTARHQHQGSSLFHRQLLLSKTQLSNSATNSTAARIMEDVMIGDGLKPNIVFVLGAPGSGKGTQCSMIVKDFNYIHLSAGDLLRLERDTPGSPYGDMILAHMKQGTIVPVEVTCSLLENAMRASQKAHFLIDGFPRNQDNLLGWEKQMGHKVNLQFVLLLDAPEDICVKRILVRGASSGRPDDNIESLKKRFQTFVNDTMPIIEHYRGRGLVRTVDSTQTPEVCHQEISNLFKTANERPVTTPAKMN